MRAFKLLAAVYFAFTAFGLLLWRVDERSEAPVDWASPIGVVEDFDAQTPQLWFNKTQMRCNSAEVATHVLSVPDASSETGLGYAAACWAKAGRVDDARSLIEAIPQTSQPWVAQLIFGTIHPDADSGRESEVAPAMELVLEYQPNNVMALYHAGSAAYADGRSSAAQEYLERFVEFYGPQDGWTSNARAMLDSLGAP